MLWLTYFDLYGEPPPDRSDFYYRRSVASSPEGLGPSAAGSEAAALRSRRGPVQPQHHRQLSDCAASQSRALISQAAYLSGTNCVVFQDGVDRRTGAPRRSSQEANGYSYVGALRPAPTRLIWRRPHRAGGRVRVSFATPSSPAMAYPQATRNVHICSSSGLPSLSTRLTISSRRTQPMRRYPVISRWHSLSASARTSMMFHLRSPE